MKYGSTYLSTALVTLPFALHAFAVQNYTIDDADDRILYSDGWNPGGCKGYALLLVCASLLTSQLRCLARPDQTNLTNGTKLTDLIYDGTWHEYGLRREPIFV